MKHNSFMDKNKSILKEAILDYKELLEAAEKKAKSKLAEDMPIKFNSLIKEELEKIKPTYNKTSVIKSKETKKSINEDADKQDDENYNAFSMDKIEEMNNIEENEELSEDSEFDIEDIKKQLVDLVDDEVNRQIDKDMNKKNTSVNVDEGMLKKVVKNLLKEQYEDAELRMLSEELDEFDLDDLDTELDESEDDKRVERIKSVVKKQFTNEDEDYGDTSRQNFINKYFANEEVCEDCDDINEEEGQLDPDELPPSLGESHGMSLSNNKKTGANVQPRVSYAEYKKNKLRSAQQNESVNKRIAKLSESVKGYKNKEKEYTKLVEQYKSVLIKYRNQLNEMVLFNTNLSNMNNILMNEELTDTDKRNLVESFKKCKNINESDATYKTLVENFDKKSKIVLKESVEKKIGNVVDTNSKQNLGEAVVKSSFVNNPHIDKIKKMFDYMDKR